MFERGFALHKLKSLGRARQEIGQASAACRRHVIGIVFSAAYGCIKARDRFVAQRAIEVQMQLDLGEPPEIHINKPYST